MVDDPSFRTWIIMCVTVIISERCAVLLSAYQFRRGAARETLASFAHRPLLMDDGVTAFLRVTVKNLVLLG
jgi:hypothetical protein